MSRVKRKPPPAFPYSPRYPSPDPLDPFAPLKVLRQRASSNDALRFNLDNSSLGQLVADPHRDGFLPSLGPDHLGRGLDINYPPSSTDHDDEALSPPRRLQDYLGGFHTPPRPLQDLSAGYHSDTLVLPPTRSHRSRVKPVRESKAYYSEAELPPTPPILYQREEHQGETSRESQYQYRRRSRSVFIPRPPSNVEEQNEPPVADVRPTNASMEALTTSPNVESKSETDTVHDLVRQYMYDDRQSHGYFFDHAEARDVHHPPTVEAHAPEQSQSQPSATPPMTPDDTLSLSSSNTQGRSASLSPRSIMPDLPRVISQPTLRSKATHDEREITVQQHETPLTAPIHSSDFPLLRTPSRPSPVPASPPLSAQSHAETDPEPDTSTVRRRRLSAPKLLRRSSSTGTSGSRRRSKIISVHDFLVKKPSTGSNASKSSQRAGKVSPPQRVDAAVSTADVVRKSVTAATLSASITQPQIPRETKKPELKPGRSLAFSTSLTHPRNTSTHRSGDSDPGTGSKSTRYTMHRPKKSLSHVSLVLAALPNVNDGPPMARSANPSVGSAVTTGTGGLSDNETSTQTHEFTILQRPTNAPPVPELVRTTQSSTTAVGIPRRPRDQDRPVEPSQPRVPEKPPITERSAKRLSGFAVLEDDKLGNVPKSSASESRQRTAEWRPTHAITVPTSTRPLTVISSRTASPAQDIEESSFQLLERPPTPPRTQSHSTIPSIPAPRGPSPERHRPPYLDSPLPPPPPDSPEFYKSPIPIDTSTQAIHPAPLPLSPPQHSEPPTPLPLPTPRAKSPVPPFPSKPREAHPTLPAVVRNDLAQAHSVSVRSATPPMDGRHRRRDQGWEGPSDSRQSLYLPVAQPREQPQAAVQTDMHAESIPPAPAKRRVSTAQISGPIRQPTPPTDTPHPMHQLAMSPVQQPPYRARSPEPETPYNYPSYFSHEQTRAQSPPTVPEFRAQSPSPAVLHSRVRSPHTSTRMHSTPRKVSRARSPSSSQDHTISRGRSFDALQSFAPLSREQTAHSNGTHGSRSNMRHHDTAPATPVPQQTSPSPTTTINSQPILHSRTERRTRSQIPLRAERYQDRRQQQLVANLKFDEYGIPTWDQIKYAGSLFVVAQNGLRVQFSELFKERRTVVCFIRHFWCPADQDYMYSIARGVDAEALKHAGIELAIIGLGSPAMIKSYRQIFRTPFSVYTDPTLRLHAALGMTRQTQDSGSDEERGEYVRHGPLGGLAMVVRNAIRVGMPVWEKGGDVSQLGGEFVFGPGSTCSYAHRMRTTRSHAPILRVLSVAGFNQGPLGVSGMAPSYGSQESDEAWMEDRRKSYARIQARREKRQEANGRKWHRREDSQETTGGYASDVGTGSMSGCWGSNSQDGGGVHSELGRVESRGREQDPQRERKRDVYPSARDEKRGMGRGFHIANPDFPPHTPLSEDGTYGSHGRGGDMSDLPYLDGIGRTRDESYRLTQEVLAYSFGGK